MATEYDKVNTGALATILTVGALAMLGISAAVTALVRYEGESHIALKGGSANVRAVQELEATHSKDLSAEPRWVDRGKNRLGVPVDRAMKLVLEDLQRNPNLATPPPPDPKEKKQEEEQPPEGEQSGVEPTAEEQMAAGQAPAEPAASPAAPAPEAAAGETPATKPAAKPAGQKPPSAPQAPAPPAPPSQPPAQPAPSPQAPPG